MYVFLVFPSGATPLEFHQDIWQQKTRDIGKSCGVLVIINLAVLIEL